MRHSGLCGWAASLPGVALLAGAAYAETLTLQQGADGYFGCTDTFITQSAPDGVFGAEDFFQVAGSVS